MARVGDRLHSGQAMKQSLGHDGVLRGRWLLAARSAWLVIRRFYRSTYDAVRTLAAFTTRMRDEVDMQRLSETLVEVVDETVQPAHVSLWLREQRSSLQRGVPR